ncbi:DUF3299 domain-containing protein [Fluviispira sanaruensis]|uniref:DUF3299 domain-containing protein n=1 Tax=Fluviispira sanaruensis TaxID=2493639 RepID=A0A4P2VJY0_FLUSA|nr:DUF3299 domain-containing protein [Fluviispira sanaruensis]BBH52858.1 hypothetical protein JCM31447_13010 [Fluviispira sanaruensis]
MRFSFKIILFVLFGIAGGGVAVYLISRGDSVEQINTQYNNSRVTEIDWNLLQQLDVTTGLIPKDLKVINGAMIKIPGFIIPLEDNQDFVDEFLFVPSPMACIHVPPPPPNQIIHVKMASGKKAKMSYGPVWLTGKFILLENSGKKIKASFEMLGSQTLPYM